MIRPEKDFYTYNARVKILGLEITDRINVNFPKEKGYYLSLQIAKKMIFKSSFNLSSSNLTAMISLDNYLQSFLDTIKEIPGYKQPFGYYYATCKFYVAMNFINFSLAMM